VKISALEKCLVVKSWYNANEFTKRLTLKDKANSYRLPTEAEWEYAARAGTETKFSFGNDENLLNAYGWYKENAYDIEDKYPHIVKQLKPNSWGLYDMHGNVWEWVADWHGAYLEAPVGDPTGPKTGSSRVLRGGAFDYEADGARSAFRADNGPNRRLVAPR
jgi:formylglycine-generating enzyme required for sulfatase activity